ncbi:Transcription regulator LuxR, C-terminal [Candidatus Nanopelagicaceae bacterium]
MAPKKGDINFEVVAGATLSRTLIPALPPTHLSRKRLFTEFTTIAPSTTLILAPAGYGKTSLVSEWVQSQKRKTIWLTVTPNDSLDEMAALLIQATRNVIADFGRWFEKEQPIRPVEVVRRWGNDLLATGEEYIFVLDSFRELVAKDVELASRLIDQFPSNIIFVPIRRDGTGEMMTSLSARGPVSIVEANELRFTRDEIMALAKSMSIQEISPDMHASIMAANGWPTATAMLLDAVKKSKKAFDFEKMVATELDPLKALATQMLSLLTEDEMHILTRLSAVSEFDHELAQVILESEYSYDAINAMGLSGNFFSKSASNDLTFTLSPLMREVLLVELRKNAELKKSIHQRLMNFYEFRNKPNLALEHAYLAGEVSKVQEIFPDAARILQATGHGGELIRWSLFAGDSSPEGQLLRKTVELAGHLTSLEYKTTQSLIESLDLDAKGNVLEGFISQITASAGAYLDLAHGRFDALQEKAKIVLAPIESPHVIGIEEQIATLRLLAIRAFIFEDVQELERLTVQASELARNSKIPNTQIFLTSIRALSEFTTGNYRLAFESASLSHNQARSAGFVGIVGPLDSMYVMARCLLEFSRADEANELFREIKNLGEQWKQYHWHFLADGYLARDLAFRGLVSEGLEKIDQAHKRLSLIDNSGNLVQIIDLSEIFIRQEVKDYERLLVLLERGLDTRYVHQSRLVAYQLVGKKLPEGQIKSLPTHSPKQQLWKHLAEATANIDQETLALASMRRALDIGAQIGAKETFLRQGEELGNLIIKIAGENPTVYLEELGRAMTERIRETQTTTGEFSSSLTKRELEVLRHLATERPISAIAATLHISQNTMKTHLKNLYRKMGADGRVTAVEKAKANFIL